MKPETTRAVRRQVKPVTLPAVRLLSDRILVKLDKPERLSHGLWIPDGAEHDDWDLYRATVIACGPGSRNKYGNLTPVEVVPGDKVLVYWLAVAEGKGKAKGQAGPFDSIMSRECGHRIYSDQSYVVVRETDIRLAYEA